MKTYPFKNLKETIEACEKMGFGPQITAEVCWNTAYEIGRDRWHWGPRWLSEFKGWIRSPGRWFSWLRKKETPA